VTQSDQTNLVACKVAHSVFNVPARIARLRARDFLDSEKLLAPENFAVDYALCPEQVITEYIARLVDFPEALQVLNFGGGRLVLVGVRAYAGGLLVGSPIKEMRGHLPPEIDGRIAAIYRRDGAITPTGETIIEDGDEVFLLAAEEHIRAVMRELRRSVEPVKRVMIAGGGNIGMRVAQALARQVPGQADRGRPAARRVTSPANSSRSSCCTAMPPTRSCCSRRRSTTMDLFLALTNDDEDNIMARVAGQEDGVQRVVALINRRAYAELVQGGPIDIAISPAQVSIGRLLTYVRHGDVAQVHSLRRGAAEALEIVAHGDRKTSKVVGRTVGELPQIHGAFIAAIVRDLDKSHDVGFFGLAKQKQKGRVLIAHKDVVIETDDHVIVFCLDKKVVKQVEKLFAVGFHFF
jgi:trk system potassium uptake protein TrkA